MGIIGTFKIARGHGHAEVIVFDDGYYHFVENLFKFPRTQFKIDEQGFVSVFHWPPDAANANDYDNCGRWIKIDSAYEGFDTRFAHTLKQFIEDYHIEQILLVNDDGH